MSLTFVIKATGEEITLPSHTGNEPAKIDPLPGEFHFIFIEGDEFERLVNQYYSLPWYKRFIFKVKYFWYRYV